jgi:hypothetical protein
MFNSVFKRQPRHGAASRSVINRAAEGSYQEVMAGPGLAMTRVGRKMLVRLASSVVGIEIAKTKTSITGRSGTVPGTGTVYFVRFDGTDLDVTTTEYETRNISAGSLASNKYCFVVRLFGTRWLIAGEC